MGESQEGQGLLPHAHPSQIEHDETMQHPRCVMQILKRHYARYTPEVVEQICGIPQENFLKIADTLVKNSGREGSFTNTQRLIQYRDQAMDSPDDARSENWFLTELYVRLKELYKNSSKECDKPIQNLACQPPYHLQSRLG